MTHVASHVLLVEDDETLAGLLSAHLRARGYQVTVAPTAEIATDLLGKGITPDLVLLDINLPGETGWSVLRSQAFEAAGRPPVVVASAMAVSPARLREFGVAGYLPKPFAMDTLGTTLDRLLTQGEGRNVMTDLQIAVIGHRLYRRVLGLPAPLRTGRTMTPLEILAGIAAAFVFVYLLWALLRPEDF